MTAIGQDEGRLVTDSDQLPPTQYLVMEVLAARHRLGEGLWTFPTRFGKQLRALEDVGLINYKNGVVQGTYMAWLTDDGRSAALSEDYRPPSVADDVERRVRQERADEAKRWEAKFRGLLGAVYLWLGDDRAEVQVLGSIAAGYKRDLDALSSSGRAPADGEAT